MPLRGMHRGESPLEAMYCELCVQVGQHPQVIKAAERVISDSASLANREAISRRL